MEYLTEHHKLPHRHEKLKKTKHYFTELAFRRIIKQTTSISHVIQSNYRMPLENPLVTTDHRIWQRMGWLCVLKKLHFSSTKIYLLFSIVTHMTLVMQLISTITTRHHFATRNDKLAFKCVLRITNFIAVLPNLPRFSRGMIYIYIYLYIYIYIYQTCVDCLIWINILVIIRYWLKTEDS